MNQKDAQTALDRAASDLIDNCPHCGARAHLKLLFSDSHSTNRRDIIYYAIFRCVPCKGLVLKTFRFEQDRYDANENLKLAGWLEKFPKEDTVKVSKFEGSVPDDVLEDYREGVICLSSNCHRASVSMFRRALQSSLLERSADPKKELIEQIRDASFLTQDIKDWSHNIRIFGNWGAHPQSDNLKDADESVSKETQAFLEEYFNYVYVMPARVTIARQKNTAHSNAIP